MKRILALMAILTQCQFLNCSGRPTVVPAQASQDGDAYRLIWRDGSFVDINRNLIDKSEYLSALIKWETKSNPPLIAIKIIPMIGTHLRPRVMQFVQDLYNGGASLQGISEIGLIRAANAIDYLQIDSKLKESRAVVSELVKYLKKDIDIQHPEFLSPAQQSIIDQLGIGIRRHVMKLYTSDKLVNKDILQIVPLGESALNLSTIAEFSNDSSMIAIENFNHDDEVFTPSTVTIKQLNELRDSHGLRDIQIRPITGIGSIAFSPDDKLISVTPDIDLARNSHGDVNIFDTADGTPIRTVTLEDAFPTGSLIIDSANPIKVAISTTRPGGTRALKLPAGAPIQTIFTLPMRHGSINKTMAISHNKKFMIATENKTTMIINPKNGVIINTLIDEAEAAPYADRVQLEVTDINPINNAFISKDDEQIITTSDKKIKIWNASNAALLKTINSERLISHADISTDGKYIATASLNRIVIWDAQDTTGNDVIAQVRAPRNFVTKAMKFTPNNDILWAGALDISGKMGDNIFRITGINGLDSIDYDVFTRQPKSGLVSRLKARITGAR